MSARDRRRTVIVAGHRGDLDIVQTHADDADATVREAVLGALDRLDRLDDDSVAAAMTDPVGLVRRRAAELAGARPCVSLRAALDDEDATVVEVAAWACGEQQRVADDVLGALIGLVTGHDDALVREAAAASLGAIGDPRGLPAVLTACGDKPHVRRRAVLALAPFDGDDVERAIDAALTDRDWQVRQAAEDLRRAAGEVELG